MKRIFTYQIDQCHAGMTIHDFLRAEGYSRSLLIQLKKSPEGIRVNGEWQLCKYLLKAGDELQTLITDESSSEQIPPTPMELAIVYEDEDILVVNKPADTPIHPSLNNYDNSLANGVSYYFKQKGEPFVFRCINRLDRDTTGLTIIAKNALSACILSDMVKNREISREYRCLADGLLTGSGTINAPIGRVNDSLVERKVDFENGETAITHYTVLKNYDSYSYVSLHLETGRTHQIRVHMSYLGHPLLGDFLYHPDYPFKNYSLKNDSLNDSAVNDYPIEDGFMKNDVLTACSHGNYPQGQTHEVKPVIGRQALHAYRLQFHHPITKETLDFIADVPEDMKKLCNYEAIE